MLETVAVLPPETERHFQGAVVKVARLFGWRVQWHWSSLHSPAGFPDLILVRGERMIAAELKRERGRVAPEQQAWLEDLERVPGIESYVWRPSLWEEILEILR